MAPKRSISGKSTQQTKRSRVDAALKTSGKGTAGSAIQQSKRPKIEPHLSHRSLTAPDRKLRIYSFGDGGAGELGLGSKIDTAKRPEPIPLANNVCDIAAGGMHSIALESDGGNVLTWGVNDEAALGRNTSWDGGLRDIDDEGSSNSEAADLNPLESTPMAVSIDVSGSNSSNVVHVMAGDSATFALTDAGFVYGWGTFRDSEGNKIFRPSTTRGQEPINNQRTPGLISGLRNIVQLSAGADFALALDSTGRVYAWGHGQHGELGRRVLERRRLLALLPTPVEIPGKRKIRSIHTGANHAFAIDVQGDTWAWGLNNFHQTGITGHDVVTAPTKVKSLVGKDMKMIAGGNHHSIGVTNDGQCLVWGRADGGQMGISISNLSAEDILLDDRQKPRVLVQPTVVQAVQQCNFVAAGSSHCIALTSEGKAYSWGFNVSYQCGHGDDDDDVLTAKLIGTKLLSEKKIVWAGAGGQVSLLGVDESI